MINSSSTNPGTQLPKLEGALPTRPGGFWIRLVAMFIDGMVINILISPFLAFYYLQFFKVNEAIKNAEQVESQILALMGPLLFSAAILLIGSFVVVLFYYGWFYKNKGATPGKMIFKLRVVNKTNGENLSYGKTFLREVIGKMLSGMTFSIGYIMAGFRQDKRALHDLIANTQVIQKR